MVNPEIPVPFSLQPPTLYEPIQPELFKIDASVDYVGNIVYNGTTRLLLTEEGFVTLLSNGEPRYHYYLRDHLGSIRAVLNHNGIIDEKYDYYPSGANFLISQKGTSSENSRLLFCGKELDRMHGLDWYDSKARYLDVLCGARFTSMDPLAEQYPEVSPYAYCKNNFVNAVDPDGKDDYRIWDNGLIKRFSKNDNKEDKLFSYDSNSHISLKRGILNQLLEKKSGYNGHFAILENTSDAFKLFK